MSRLTALVAAVVLAVTVQHASAQTTIPVGKKTEGVFREPITYTDNIDDARNSIRGCVSEFFVYLKGGEPLTVMAEVIGDERNVAVLVEDEAGVRTVFAYYKPSRVTASVKMLHVTGKYKIKVFSDKIGDFNVKVVSPNAPAPPSANSAQDLEEKISRLKEELEQAQEELKALSAKRSDK